MTEYFTNFIIFFNDSCNTVLLQLHGEGDETDDEDELGCSCEVLKHGEACEQVHPRHSLCEHLPLPPCRLLQAGIHRAVERTLVRKDMIYFSL